MAHAITRTNGRDEMAFVGETPWHGLGARLTQGATIEVWAREAGMEWQALTATPTFTRADGTIGKVGEKRVIYRSDTGAPLSVMGDGFNVVQPRDILEFFRSATENGGWHIHTAGTLHGGRRMWAMAHSDDAGETIVKGDRVKPNLLLATALDGTMRTLAVPTAIRVVCANTVAAALGCATATVALSHRSVFDPGVILDAMTRAGDEFAGFVAAARAMADKGISTEQARDILRALFDDAKAADSAKARAVTIASRAATAASESAALMARLGAKPAADDAAKDHRNVGRVLELFAGRGRGADAKGVAGTAWGLFSAVTEFADHEAARTADTRLASAWFGRGAALKSRAAELILAA